MPNKELKRASLIDDEKNFDDNPAVSFCSEGKAYSYYNDEIWVLPERNSTVKFHKLEGKFKKAIKHLIYELIIKKNTIVSARTFSGNWIEGAIACQKVIIATGGDSYRYIESDLGYRKFICHAKTLKIKHKTWKNNLIILSKLYNMGLLFRKIESSDALARELSYLSEKTQQTMAIPEKIAAAYIKSSIDIVERYYPYRFSISKAYGEFIENYDHFKQQHNYTATSRQKAQEIAIHNIPYEDFSSDLTGVWLSWLRGACYILIASFTGCRDGEIQSFDLNSYSEEVYGDMRIPLVSGIHSKTNIGGAKRKTTWVTTPLTQKAIELLWHSFDFARDIWKKRVVEIDHVDDRDNFIKKIDSLFLNLPYRLETINPNAGRQSIRGSLSVFVNSVGHLASANDVKEFDTLNPTRKNELKIGHVLIPNPHAFRRTFAVFLVRNKLGSLINLKYQYKHVNIAMTAWYSNQANVAGYLDMTVDDELMCLIAEENHDFMTDTLYHIYNEAEALSGKEGERIMSARGQSSASIYLSRDEISRQVKNGQMSIIENPFGHCTNPVCTRICDMQTCKYKIVTKEKALSLLPIREKLVLKFKAMKELDVRQPNILSKIFYDIKSIDKSLSEHEIAYTSFDETISVSML